MHQTGHTLRNLSATELETADALSRFSREFGSRMKTPKWVIVGGPAYAGARDLLTIRAPYDDVTPPRDPYFDRNAGRPVHTAVSGARAGRPREKEPSGNAAAATCGTSENGAHRSAATIGEASGH